MTKREIELAKRHVEHMENMRDRKWRMVHAKADDRTQSRLQEHDALVAGIAALRSQIERAEIELKRAA